MVLFIKLLFATPPLGQSKHGERIGIGHGFDLGMIDGIVRDELGSHRHVSVRTSHQVDERTLVAHCIAVVRRREHGDAAVAVHAFVALLLYLDQARLAEYAWER